MLDFDLHCASPGLSLPSCLGISRCYPCLFTPRAFCLQFGIAIRAGFALRFAWAQPSPRACFRVSRCYPCLFAPRAFCLQFGLASCAAFVLRFDRHRTALRGAALPSTALRNFISPAQDTPPFADGSEERSPFCVSERPRCRSPKARTLRHRLSPRLARGIDGSLVAYPVIPAFLLAVTPLLVTVARLWHTRLRLRFATRCEV